MWQYQLVKYKGTTYCFTRLDFGLNVTPKIMVAMLKTVLKQEETIEKATSSYINDILVDELVVQVEEVRCHLEKHGIAKPLELLDLGTSLGLKLQKNTETGELVFQKGNHIPLLTNKLSEQLLFSTYGETGCMQLCKETGREDKMGKPND